MDRRVKERLVGATILVVLIVLIVPELLSGPKRRVVAPALPAAAESEEQVRNVTVDLTTNKATQETASAASAAASAFDGAGPAGQAPPGAAPPADAAALSIDAPGQPAAAAAPPTVTTLKAQPAAPPVLENEVSPPTSPTPAPDTSRSGAVHEPAPAPAAVSHHGWAVQLGSFASRTNAETLVQRLKAQYSSAYVSPSGKGTALLYRVRIGPLADRGAAERFQLKLKKEGVMASLIPP